MTKYFEDKIAIMFRTLVKSAYQKNIFLISQPKHNGSFEHPKHMLKLMGKKIFTILCSKIVFI